jgi:hypothetical protein
MNKRQVIHDLIDKLFDIDESGTKKELFFYYHTGAVAKSFNFHFSEGSGSREYVLPSSNIYFESSLQTEKLLEDALKDIETIKNTPDAEPKINLNISIEKARELGLIA